MVIINLPDNSKLVNKYIDHYRIELGRSVDACFNKINYINNRFGQGMCYFCNKCKQAIVVEKTEDNKEIWVEFEEEGSC